MRLAVSGYYGCGNTGDEAVLAGIVESFRRRGPELGIDARITALSADPADTRARHGLDAVDRMSLGAVRRALRECDLLLSGGGSLLQDTTSLRSLAYYLWIVLLARFSGRPVMFYAQGIGPLRRGVSRAITRIVANRVQAITVRDEASAALLREIGVTRPPIEVTADPAFALAPAPAREADNLMAEAGFAPGEAAIGVALRPWPGGPAEIEYARMASGLAESTGSRLLFLPMQPPGDLELSRRVAARVGDRAVVWERPLSPAQAVAVTGRLQGLCAMRLHALIFGAMAAVPMIAIGYDPKVEQLMGRLGQAERCLPLTGFRGERAADLALAALAEGDSLRASLGANAHSMTALALRNVNVAAGVLAGRIGRHARR